MLPTDCCTRPCRGLEVEKCLSKASFDCAGTAAGWGGHGGEVVGTVLPLRRPVAVPLIHGVWVEWVDSKWPSASEGSEMFEGPCTTCFASSLNSVGLVVHQAVLLTGFGTNAHAAHADGLH